MTSISYKEDRRTSRKSSIKAIIALVLVVVSMLMLLFPWISISINVRGKNYSLPEIIDLICVYDETTKAEFKAGLQSEFENMSKQLAYMDIDFNAKKATKTVEKILDGGISPLEAASISSYVGGFLGDIEDSYSHNYADLPMEARMNISLIGEAKASLVAVAIVLWLMIIAMCVVLIYSVCTLFTNKKAGVLIYTGLSVILVVVFAVAVGKMNSTMESASDFVEMLLDDALWILGVSSSTALNFKLFNLTAVPFICLICAVAACAVTFLKTTPRVHTPKRSSGGWTCRCGTVNRLNNEFCTHCGTKRPNVARCDCGAELVDGASYCRICGRKLPPISEKPRCSCGAELVEGAQYCKVCGKKVSTDPVPTPPPAPPMPEEKRCARCGKVVYGDAKYCVSCKSIMDTSIDGLTPPSDDDLD